MAQQPYVGEIRMFAGNFAPAGWMFCEGQTISISENETLFQLIGTTFGGDGQSDFKLPDLRGRVPVHYGAGSFQQFGAIRGEESVTLNSTQMPNHNHQSPGPQMPYRGDGPGNTGDPTNNGLGIGVGKKYYTTVAQPGTMAALDGTITVDAQGGSQPHDNMQPYLCVSFIISLFGIFPSQT